MSNWQVKNPLITLEAIDKGIALVEAKAKADIQDLAEAEDVELIAARLRNKEAQSKIKNIKADRKMRKQYASRILRYLECYSGGVAILILLNGFKIWNFELKESVLAVLVGSTATAAIGLVGFIARGLFKSPLENHRK